MKDDNRFYKLLVEAPSVDNSDLWDGLIIEVLNPRQLHPRQRTYLILMHLIRAYSCLD